MNYHTIFNICILCVLWGSYSCKDNNVEHYQDLARIEIDPNDIESSVSRYNLFEDVRYIKLQTDSNYVLGNIDKVIVHDDYLFVIDKKRSKAVFGFNNNGEFLFKISTHGKGPGEFVHIEEVVLDKFDGKIEIYDKIQKKIIRYDFKGVFQDEQFFPFYITSFARLNNELYVFFTDEHGNFIGDIPLEHSVIYSLKGELNVLNKYLPSKSKDGIPPRLTNTIVNFGLNHSLIFWESNQVIYDLTNEGPVSKYVIDFGKNNLPKERRNLIQSSVELDKALRDGYVVFAGNYYWETPNFVYFNYAFKDHTIRGMCYSKSTDSVRLFTLEREHINYLDGLQVSKPPVGTIKDELIFVLQPSQFHAILNRSQKGNIAKPKVERQIIEIAESVSEYDNPIIAFYKIKKF